MTDDELAVLRTARAEFETRMTRTAATATAAAAEHMRRVIDARRLAGVLVPISQLPHAEPVRWRPLVDNGPPLAADGWYVADGEVARCRDTADATRIMRQVRALLAILNASQIAPDPLPAPHDDAEPPVLVEATPALATAPDAPPPPEPPRDWAEWVKPGPAPRRALIGPPDATGMARIAPQVLAALLEEAGYRRDDERSADR